MMSPSKQSKFYCLTQRIIGVWRGQNNTNSPKIILKLAQIHEKKWNSFQTPWIIFCTYEYILYPKTRSSYILRQIFYWIWWFYPQHTQTMMSSWSRAIISTGTPRILSSQILFWLPWQNLAKFESYWSKMFNMEEVAIYNIDTESWELEQGVCCATICVWRWPWIH